MGGNSLSDMYISTTLFVNGKYEPYQIINVLKSWENPVLISSFIYISICSSYKFLFGHKLWSQYME